MNRDALQTFQNINGPTRENLGEILAVSRRKYVKHQSMATAKHKFKKRVFNPANQKLVDFIDELQKLAKYAFGIAAHAIIEQFIHVKKPPHPEKSMNQAHLERVTYEHIVTHLEGELELNDFEAPDELQIKSVSYNTAKTNADRPKPTCQHCKKTRTFQKSVPSARKGKKNNLKKLKTILETKIVAPITPPKQQNKQKQQQQLQKQ